VINPGGGSNPGEQVTVRQWGSGNYAEFIQLLASRRQAFHILLSGGKDDAELCERIMASSRVAPWRSRIQSIAGKTNLHELRRLLDDADLFITGDTGGMHVASAAGAPILSLFGPTDPREKAPLISNATAVKTTAPCAPCYHGKFRGCSYAFCMNEISPRQVLLESERLLEAADAR
ncbi:MAG: glycosyltransferase family 9 protein, partial [Spirochaetia bacterium]|nr:glycosyltransferase family 9 protein [Spirochaetia bacterium]